MHFPLCNALQVAVLRNYLYVCEAKPGLLPRVDATSAIREAIKCLQALVLRRRCY